MHFAKFTTFALLGKYKLRFVNVHKFYKKNVIHDTNTKCKVIINFTSVRKLLVYNLCFPIYSLELRKVYREGSLGYLTYTSNNPTTSFALRGVERKIVFTLICSVNSENCLPKRIVISKKISNG